MPPEVAPDAQPAPSPLILDGWSAYGRAQAGPGWRIVRAAEADACEARAGAAARWPGTPGIASRFALLARRGASLFDGPQARLARATLAQERPWRLHEEPLHSTLAQMAAFARHAREIVHLLDVVEELRAELRRMRLRYAEALPGAWARWESVSGVTEERIGACRSLRALDAVRFWLRTGATRLAAREEAINLWLADAGPDVTHSPGGPEFQYEMLLTLSRIDRAPLHREARRLLRHGAGVHLQTLESLLSAAKRDPSAELALQYASRGDSETLTADESWVYAETIALHHRLCHARRRNEP